MSKISGSCVNVFFNEIKHYFESVQIKVFCGLSKDVCIAFFMALHSQVLLLAFLSSPNLVVTPRM